MTGLTDNHGNVAIAFALAAPVLLIAAGGAVDFQNLGGQRAEMQAAADALATRGAREFLLENSSEFQIEALVRATAEAQYAESLGVFTLAATADDDEKTVTAELTQAPRKGLFLHNLPAYQRPVTVRATAVARGAANVCVVALEKTGGGAIKVTSAAKLAAAKCSILSNSTASKGVDASGYSKLTAALICSAGGASGGSSNFEPQVLTDCPVYEDPLKDRLEPDAGACDHNNLALGEAKSGSELFEQTLATLIAAIDGSDEDTLAGYTRFDISPGVYCGGLRIRADADVHLEPGIYVFKDGPLEVELGGRLFGEGAGLFFTGPGAVFTFWPASIVHLTAPTDGLMAGMLVMEDRERNSVENYSILSDNARTLLGTIYLPNGRLRIASLMPIADNSAYTAIVVRYLQMFGSPQLVLNTDYTLTDVPVPEGIGSSGGQVFLRE
ncbi:MAG: TadE/TadG family type IV pilus assembly protein [Parvularculaceae bacterium]|nr:TadE/TadG family type IV pilus assembly protein [Parvularculaceae bacterium]